jgi:hypothetical protein
MRLVLKFVWGKKMYYNSSQNFLIFTLIVNRSHKLLNTATYFKLFPSKAQCGRKFAVKTAEPVVKKPIFKTAVAPLTCKRGGRVNEN